MTSTTEGRHPAIGEALTPQTETLRRRVRDQMEAERLRMFTEQQPLLVRQASLRHRIELDLHSVETAKHELDQLARQPSEALLAMRFGGEIHTSTAVTRRRRHTEYDRRRSAAEDRYRQAAEQLAATQIEITTIELELRQLDLVTNTRARRLLEYGWRRVATYWQRLMRGQVRRPQSSDGFHVTGPDLPSWVAPTQEHRELPQ